MKQFKYVITDEVGLHARPAGLLAKKAKEFESVCTIEKGGKSVNITKLMALMGLGVKQGDTVTVTCEGADDTKLMAIMGMGVKKDMEVEVTVEGGDEEAAAAEMEAFFKENL